MAVGGIVREGDLRVLSAATGLSPLAGVAGLAVLGAWRGRVPESEAGVGTIGSP